MQHQATNEELLASKEASFRFVNQELTALNSQLQETLERQRTTADDLQNVLYSTPVQRFSSTRASTSGSSPRRQRALFNVIPSDVAALLNILKSLAADDALLDDAQTVFSPDALRAGNPGASDRSCAWMMPYRDDKIEGVVITYEDVTERRRTAEALTAAKRQAELASVAKSRFLAAASHDLRQPLQTLALLQGLLAKKVVGEKAQKLVRASTKLWAP